MQCTLCPTVHRAIEQQLRSWALTKVQQEGHKHAHAGVINPLADMLPNM